MHRLYSHLSTIQPQRKTANERKTKNNVCVITKGVVQFSRPLEGLIGSVLQHSSLGYTYPIQLQKSGRMS